MNAPIQSIEEWLFIADNALKLGLQRSFIAAMNEITIRARGAAVAATIEWPLAQPVTSHQSPVTEAEAAGLSAAEKEAA